MRSNIFQSERRQVFLKDQSKKLIGAIKVSKGVKGDEIYQQFCKLLFLGPNEPILRRNFVGICFEYAPNDATDPMNAIKARLKMILNSKIIL